MHTRVLRELRQSKTFRLFVAVYAVAVHHRLLGDNRSVDTARLIEIVAEDLGIDGLGSFGAKLARMQDTVVDKLIPVMFMVLEQLRIMRDEIRDFRSDLSNRMDRLETRMSSMEHMIGLMYAGAADDRAAVQDLAKRVDRIERRLELRDDS